MSLIGLVFAALIVVLMAFSAFKTYFKEPQQNMTQQLREAAPDQKVEASTYGGILDDARSRVRAAAQRSSDRIEEAQELR